MNEIKAYHEDLQLFFGRIREDNNLTNYQVEDFIKDVAFGKKTLILDNYEEYWVLEKRVKELNEENEDLMDALQDLRNTPARNTI